MPRWVRIFGLPGVAAAKPAAAVHQGYLEPHACLVEVDPGSTSATVWTSTQATFYVRDSVASILGLDNTSVRAIGTPVGGGHVSVQHPDYLELPSLKRSVGGLDKKAALYMYPYEGHGPAARETILDLWARWVTWLDIHVKNPDQGDATAKPEPERDISEARRR